jgi:hypothetical protein
MSFVGSVGQAVRLNVPGNHRLDGSRAVIVEFAEWGAHVHAPAAATGRFRALYSEMEPIAGKETEKMSTAIDQGFTGDVCITCGGCRMRRSGSCTVCSDCGSTSSCG